jgi:hypothetical protein
LARHRLIYGGVDPVPPPELEVLLADLRVLDPTAIGDAILHYLRLPADPPEGLDEQAAFHWKHAEYAGLHAVLRVARDRGVDGASLQAEVARLLTQATEERHVLQACVVAYVLPMTPLAPALADMLARYGRVGETGVSPALVQALATSGTGEQVADLIERGKEWKGNPDVGPALIGILGARAGLDACMEILRARPDARTTAMATHLCNAMRREGFTRDELRTRIDAEEDFPAKHMLFSAWCSWVDETPAAWETHAAELLALAPSLTDERLRDTAIANAFSYGSGKMRLRTTEAASGLNANLWPSYVMNTWHGLDAGDRPRLVAHVLAVEPDLQRRLVQSLHGLLRPRKPRRTDDLFQERYASLAEALREDPELRRLLDEAAAPKQALLSPVVLLPI